MKVTDIRQLTPAKLMAELKKVRREFAATRFHVKTGQKQDTAKLKRLRKTIARILTIYKEKTV